MKPNFLIGCDPEFFITKNGEPVSAQGLLPGTKSDPTFLEKGMLQVDGLAGEFGIEPAATEQEFQDNISSVIADIQLDFLGGNYGLLLEPSVRFSDEVIQSQTKEALALGCEPDFDCFTGQQNPQPVLEDPNVRPAGGHLHVGWCSGVNPFDPDHFNACRTLVAQLNKNLAIPSRAWDKDTRRFRLYGLGGAFRPKPYGVEYRSLSNAWLRKPETIKFVYRATMLSIQEVSSCEKHLFSPVKSFGGKLSISNEVAARSPQLANSFGEAMFNRLSIKLGLKNV
jgi:hypothetical protein